MPADVLDQLQALGGVLDRLVEPVTFDELDVVQPEVEPDTGSMSQTPISVIEIGPRRDDASARRSMMLVAACAAAVLAVAAAAVTWRGDRSDDRADDRATGTAPITSPLASSADVGVFPSGGDAGARSAGYSSPADVVNAYMADRTDRQHLPPDYTVVATVGEVTTIDADTAVVAVSLQTPDDGGDALVVTKRVGTASVWQVTAAAIFVDELRDVTIADGVLSGSIAPDAGGTTVLSAYDIMTGEQLDSTTVTLPTDAQDSTTRPMAAFQLATGSAGTVSLRYWNVVDPINAYAFANFAEVPVAADRAGFGSGWDVLRSLRDPAPAIVSTTTTVAVGDVAGSAPAPTLDDQIPSEVIPVGSDLRVAEALPGVGSIEVYDTPDRAQVCHRLTFDAGGTAAGCDDRHNIDIGRSYGYLQMGTEVPGLVFGIAAVDIGFSATIGANVVTPDEHGVWYSIVPPGTREFTMTTSEGSTLISIGP